MQTKKKILFLITKATWGGAQRYVWDLATNLPKDGFQPVVAYGTPGKLSSDLVAQNIRTVPLPSLGRDIALVSDIKSFVDIWRCVRAESPDVIHLNSSKAAGLGALAARLLRVPRIIFTAHGWPHKEPRTLLVRSLILLMSWLTALMSHEVIVVSRDDEAIARRMPLIARKVHYVPVGRSLQSMFTREEAWLFFRGVAPQLRKLKKAPRILTIAELTPNKGIRYAIEAVALLKDRGVDCTYTIISDGEEYEMLRKLADTLGASDRVALVGFVRDAAQYLYAFDVFLLPSLKEGMPYVLLEAGDARLPIVATTAANPAIAETYQRVAVVPPGSAGAIADALEQTFKDGLEPQPGYEESRFPLRIMLERTQELYLPAQAG